jgi:hypothetical protein
VFSKCCGGVAAREGGMRFMFTGGCVCMRVGGGKEGWMVSYNFYVLSTYSYAGIDI